MFISTGKRHTILDAQEIEGVKFGNAVIIEPGAVIYEGCEIGDNSVIGANSVLRPRTKIGHHTIFGTMSVSEGDNIVGDCTTIHAQCHLTKGMTVGNDVFIAPFFIASNTPSITTGHHGTYPNQELYQFLRGNIQDRVRIGINVNMIPGIRIGHDSVIWQNCLITRDIPAWSIVRAGKDYIGRVVGEVEYKNGQIR